MPPQRTNPMTNYLKYLGPNQPNLSFTFKKISMSELRNTLDKMKTTGSTAGDNISIKSIKQARDQLTPLILNMVNRIIETGTFPTELKTTKVIPIEKPEKDRNTTEGWRPVNLVCSLSKIVEKILISQLTTHLEVNQIISHSHHGAIKMKSTQTLVTNLYDKILELIHQGQDTALVLLDQSKAYDLVQHSILLQKLEALGMKQNSIKLMKDFLTDRKQFVQIQGFESGKLLIGPQSVVQGSTMSCMLYLLYILDLPAVLHDMNHNPQEQLNCPEPTIDTYVDDNYVLIPKRNNPNLKAAIYKTMDKISDYTNANRLQLNKDKTQILIVSKNKTEYKNFSIKLDNKEVKNKTKVKILGNTMDQDLTWEDQLNKNLIPNLINRIRTLKLMAKYMNPHFRRQYTNAIFRSKMLFGIETWGGCLKGTISKIQNLQEKAARIAYGSQDPRKSNRQIQTELGWLPIVDKIKLATFKMVYTIINKRIPEELAAKMPINSAGRRVQQQRKLATKPRWLGSTSLYSASFRNRAYHYKRPTQCYYHITNIEEIQNRNETLFSSPSNPKLMTQEWN